MSIDKCVVCEGPNVSVVESKINSLLEAGYTLYSFDSYPIDLQKWYVAVLVIIEKPPLVIDEVRRFDYGG